MMIKFHRNTTAGEIIHNKQVKCAYKQQKQGLICLGGPTIPPFNLECWTHFPLTHDMYNAPRLCTQSPVPSDVHGTSTHTHTHTHMIIIELSKINMLFTSQLVHTGEVTPTAKH